MTEQSIDLVYFDGCPNVDRARANLRALVPDGAWAEWNLASADTPERFRRFGSPTVLVEGRDVTGEAERVGAGAMACRTDGAPSEDTIRAALERDG